MIFIIFINFVNLEHSEIVSGRETISGDFRGVAGEDFKTQKIFAPNFDPENWNYPGLDMQITGRALQRDAASGISVSSMNDGRRKQERLMHANKSVSPTRGHNKSNGARESQLSADFFVVSVY